MFFHKQDIVDLIYGLRVCDLQLTFDKDGVLGINLMLTLVFIKVVCFVLVIYSMSLCNKFPYLQERFLIYNRLISRKNK